MIAKNSGRKISRVLEDTSRDLWLTSEEAIKYGIVDKIIIKKDLDDSTK